MLVNQMGKGLSYTLAILSLIMIMVSCKHKQDNQIIEEPVASDNISELKTDNISPDREIFYGLLTPVEISSIFSRLGASYDNEMLNPTESGSSYLSASKAALNLGVYGVDLSYLKLFELNNDMVRYLRTVRNLSNKLGIPPEFLTNPITEMQKGMSNTDSVLTYVNDAYKRIEDHLANDGRESAAGLMVLGGWIEALYIASEMLLDVDNPDAEVVARIAEQKYTLNTLLSFLKNYYDDPVVVYYTKKLKYLKKYFDRFEIFFYKDDLHIDSEKQVLKASKTEMNITRQNLIDIKNYLKLMRDETVQF